jgi:hypothetical protein
MSGIRKTDHEINHEDAIRALSVLKNDPNFKRYIEVRESMREEMCFISFN